MCWEMCKGSEINSPEPLSEGIWANGWSFHVWKCAGVHGQKLRCPSLEGYRPKDGVSVSVNVQGSMDKNSGAPPWRDTGQQTEFPCLEMCRGPWIKTPVPLPGGIRANRQSFCVWKWCRGPWIKTPVPLPGGIQANGWSFCVRKCAGVCGSKL